MIPKCFMRGWLKVEVAWFFILACLVPFQQAQTKLVCQHGTTYQVKQSVTEFCVLQCWDHHIFVICTSTKTGQQTCCFSMQCKVLVTQKAFPIQQPMHRNQTQEASNQSPLDEFLKCCCSQLLFGEILPRVSGATEVRVPLLSVLMGLCGLW